MVDQLGDWTRTHTCGALRTDNIGAEVTLLGWVHRLRDLGSLVFVDLRDRDGLTQVVVREGNPALSTAKRLRQEFVVGVRGIVRRREEGMANPQLATGEIEVDAAEIRVLSEARTPPFQIGDEVNATEELRLRYRYLDLRRPRMQAHLRLRHRVTLAIRQFFDRHGFWEIETPVLTRSTPEGARDYLVPSRVHPGKFYALPQSPQLFKQILMIAGLDRYFQIVRCFRDEDLRADRQPEFTQVDVEMAFARPESIFALIEQLMQDVCAVAGRSIATPFPRMSYADAVARYGSDKPDVRCGMPITDVTTAFRGCGFGPFREAIDQGGAVRGLVVVQGARYSRRQLDDLAAEAKTLGGAGLVWIRRDAGGRLTSPLLKAAGEQVLVQAFTAAGAGTDDVLLLAAGPPESTSTLLGQIRLTVARQERLLDPDQYAFTWIVEFPLFEWDSTEQRYVSMHHPFTSPAPEDLDRLERDPGGVRALAYDLVLNGSEIGGGSIRIHDAELQQRVFRLLSINDEEARRRFGFFLDALEYGTPPHGGIALGLDRIVAMLAGESSIREVIAFPKTAAAVDLMAGAPSEVDARQLRDLHLRLDLTRGGGS